MKLPRSRGPLSAQVVEVLGAPPTGALPDPTWTRQVTAVGDVLGDEDFQLALWLLFELHYRGFDDVPDHEWDPHAIALRASLTERFEAELRRCTDDVTQGALAATDDLEQQVAAVIDAVDGPSVARYLQREATRDEVVDFLLQRSLYHLKESDPHAFVVPRVDGRAKVALAELQYDEYGAGRPEQLHAGLFADALDAAGLDPSYGAYVDRTPGHTLAVNNVMSLFGLSRRLRGAALGHLAAFEATSSVPCRRIAAGIERVGLPDTVAAYFHEHVEADAVHEQVAIRGVCGGLLEDHPELRADVLFGVAACLHLDVLAAESLLATWGDARAAAAGRPTSQVA